MGLNPDNTSSPIRFTPSKDNSYKSSDDNRPSGVSGSRKDFKKVLEKTDEDDGGSDQAARSVGDEGEAAADQAIAEIGKKRGPPSLFDLTASRSMHTTDAPVKGSRNAGSPNDVFSKLSKTEGKKAEKSGLVEEEIPTGEIAEVDYMDAPDKGKFTTRFATEQSDLSYVNPMAPVTNQVADVGSVKTEKAVLPSSNIQEIINQMIAKVNEIKQDGRTETVVTLKHPPLFAGANIVVTAFDTAKGEFNISFENLTQAAKNILDMQINRDSLLHALEVKGYNVHILTATTLSESRPVVEEPKPNDQMGQRDQPQPHQQGREKKQT